MRQSLIIAIVLMTSACDGGISLRARVLDPDGVPIEGAKVTLAHEGYRANATTGADGCVDLFGVVAPGRYAFSVTAEVSGRKPLATEIQTLASNYCDFLLVEKGSPGDSQASCEISVEYTDWRDECPHPVEAMVEWN